MGAEVFGSGSFGWVMVHLLAISVPTSAAASTQTHRRHRGDGCRVHRLLPRPHRLCLCVVVPAHHVGQAPHILVQGLIPLLGGIILLGIGSLALGAVLMIVWEVINPEHFSGVTHD